MRLLVLGGTSFVGRHIVEAALDSGHEVTLFNRGKTNPGLFEGLEQRHGDRQAGDYASLARGEWDAVIDVNAYYPRAVREAAAALSGRVGWFTFVSTVSVYDEVGDGPVDEGWALRSLDDPATEEVNGDTYGGLKVVCEEAATAAFPGSCAIVRPGIVAGPHDPTDRFTYWVRRAALGGVMAVPARPDQPVQVIHGRDLGEFVVRATVERLDGPYNAVGPSIRFDELVAACVEAAAGAAVAAGAVEAEWVDEDWARERGFRVPLHIPASAASDGVFRVSGSKAEAAGLVNRPVVATAASTLAWDGTRGDEPLQQAPTLEEEAALVQEWRDRRVGSRGA